MDNFIINAIIAGVGIALITGLLGCFVVWKKMSYFGDSLSHSAVLGIGLGFYFGINYHISIIFIILLFALLLTYLQNRSSFSNDTLLGILAHGSLSVGIILISLAPDLNFNLHSMLFGDILLVNNNQIYFIFLTAIFIYLVIFLNWKGLILNIINKDLARSQNISNFRMDLLLTLMMGLAIAVSIQIIGVLLIVSMLIIPASSAKQLVNDPKNMVIMATIIAILTLLLGIFFSYHFDIPSGPAIIAINFALFLGITLVKRS